MSTDNCSKFRQLFNELKRLDCSSLSNLPGVVVDFDCKDERVINLESHVMTVNNNDRNTEDGNLTNTSLWSPLTIKGLEDGLIVVPGIISKEACKTWYHRLLHEWPVSQANVLKSHVKLPLLNEDKKNLRWITFGYHHDWGTKVYDMNDKDPVPIELERLFCDIATSLNLDMKPEAGIINYYNCKSRLSPHRDVSEHNYSAPLLSLSLGSPAIFMLGGSSTEDEEPIIPMLIREGDLVIMSGNRRLSYHGVPKVFGCQEGNECKHTKETCRINLNVRQVV